MTAGAIRAYGAVQPGSRRSARRARWVPRVGRAPV